MSESLKRKLGALERPSVPVRLPGRPAATALPKPVRKARKPAVRGSREPGRVPVGVESYLPGGELQTELGAFYVHERRRSELDKGTAQFLRRLAKAEKQALKLDVHEELARLLSEGLDRAVFLDLETTGLSQCPLFLVGTMTRGRADWALRQYFARTYVEERALVRHALELLEERPILVTFNGRTFDWPFLKMRAAYHRLTVGPEPFHVDLLRHARRHWRGEFENCKLQTLEWRVVGRRRWGTWAARRSRSGTTGS